MEFEECDTKCLGQIQLREKWGRQWIVTKSLRENRKGLKTDPLIAKHMFFATGVSRQQVAKASRQNT